MFSNGSFISRVISEIFSSGTWADVEGFSPIPLADGWTPSLVSSGEAVSAWGESVPRDSSNFDLREIPLDKNMAKTMKKR